jgi:hypothetical protein
MTVICDPVKAAAECKRRGDPRFGVTAKQVEATCWGKPDHVNRTETAGVISDQHVYPIVVTFTYAMALLPQFRPAARCADRQARRIAANIARLPELLRKGDLSSRHFLHVDIISAPFRTAALRAPSLTDRPKGLAALPSRCRHQRCDH